MHNLRRNKDLGTIARKGTLQYYNLLLARAQLVGNLLLEWRTKQVLEYESRAKRFRNGDIPRQPNGIFVSTACFSITDKHYEI